MKTQSFSSQHTYDFAFEMGKKAISQFGKDGAAVFVLRGELGAGKTTFAQGFAAGLDIYEKILSPTFLIVKSYPILLGKRTLYHIDCYRVQGSQDLVELGWQDIVGNPNNIVLLEWPERVPELLQIPKTEITFTVTGKEQRELTISKA